MDELSVPNFESRVNRALESVKRILDVTRSPSYPATVPHTYDDKYGLAEFLTNTSLAAFLNALEVLGLDEAKLRQLLDWAKKRSVTLRFKSEEKCTFDREEKRKVESSREYVTEYENTTTGHKASMTDKKITKIIEYFWRFDFEWELFAYRGNKVDEKIVLQSHKGQTEMKTMTKDSPRSEARSVPAEDLNITWILQQIDLETLTLKFAIDRTKSKTPRRNDNVEAALHQFADVQTWYYAINSYLRSDLFSTQQQHSLNLAAITADRVFVPILPLFEQNASSLKQIEAPSVTVPAAIAAPPAGSSLGVPKKDDAPKSPRSKDKKDKDKKKSSGSTETTSKEPVSSGALHIAVTTGPSLVKQPASKDEKKPVSSVLPIGDLNAFLAEQKRSLLEKLSEIDLAFPSTGSITVREVTVLIVTQHMAALNVALREGVDYIEKMLYDQLISAIGKEVTAVDFSNYMRFHNRKLFRSAYELLPFSYAVRRPEHTPEGTLSIEAQMHDGTIAEPIYTIMRHIPAARAGRMKFPINAATNIEFGGDRFLHGWIQHQFAGHSGSDISLVARARQFSSFIMLVGRIASATVFEPKGAIIIQNKDELKIPLLLETIPTPKEFRDAIESMSPEQQRFCKAYRAMQLESTLFGVCIIQIKPQLEKLLNLTDDSLTKEIRLTQDLQELFMKYQVPSDLLKFDGPAHTDPTTRVNSVRAATKTMQEMIESSKAKEISDAIDTYSYTNPTPPPPQPVILPTYIEEPELYIEPPRPISPRDDTVTKKPSMARKLINFFSGNKGSSSSSSASIDASPEPLKKIRPSKIASPRRNMDMALSPSRSPVSYQPESSSLRDMDMSYNAAPVMMKSAPVFESAPAPMMESSIMMSESLSVVDIPLPAPVEVPSTPSDTSSSPAEAAPDAPKSYDTKGTNSSASEVAEDFTKIPGQLDSKFDKLDEDSALRPTIINLGTEWNLKYQKALLAEPESKTLRDEEQKEQRNKAYDLLEALSRSGALSIDCAELHVVVAATHCFDQSLINTIIKDNVNPIEKVERSSLIVATTIHGDTPVQEMIKPEQVERVSTYSPNLFVTGAGASVPAIALTPAK